MSNFWYEKMIAFWCEIDTDVYASLIVLIGLFIIFRPRFKIYSTLHKPKTSNSPCVKLRNKDLIFSAYVEVDIIKYTTASRSKGLKDINHTCEDCGNTRPTVYFYEVPSIIRGLCSNTKHHRLDVRLSLEEKELGKEKLKEWLDGEGNGIVVVVRAIHPFSNIKNVISKRFESFDDYLDGELPLPFKRGR